MKRPRRLGGKSGDEEAKPEDETAPEADEKGSEAAERSARRVAAKKQGGGEARSSARRRLADRVGKASGTTDDAKAEPKKPEGRAAKDPEPAADERKDDKPLHRPRRQPAESKAKGTKRAEHKDAAKGTERPKDEDEPAAKGKERSRGKDEAGPKATRKRREPAKDSKRPARRRGSKSKSARKKAGAAVASFAAALKRGGIETRKWVAANGPKAGRGLLAALAAVFALFFAVIGFVLNVLIAAWRLVAGPLHAVLGALERAARAASRLLTPARALTVVVAGAAILLALSQYADYRSISIGNDAYSGVQTVAPAPETGRLQTGDAHSYAFVPVAIACLILLAVATIGGRWRACRLITVAGVAAVVVALLVDRPAGLDTGELSASFEGVRATLIGGFYAQIAAGVLLIGSSTLLAHELRLAASTKRASAHEQQRSPERAPGRRPSGAGGTARA